MATHAFTIDLEEWFCSHNLASAVPFTTWDLQQSLVERQVYRLVDLLNKKKVKATWFVLGWVAERYPALVKMLADEHHEIASHGYAHRLTWLHTEESFAEDLRKSTTILHSITGQPPTLFRAPAFSVVKKTSWALPILKQEGYAADSSVYPINVHPEYGWPEAGLQPFNHEVGVRELPMSCVNYFGLRVPMSGGAYLRFFPYNLYRRLIRRLEAEGRSLNFYIHPWELEENLPAVKGLGRLASARHYWGTGHSTDRKLERMLDDFQFSTLSDTYSLHQNS